MQFRHLLRMSRLARNPPSEARVRLVVAVLLICLVLFGLERFFGWPAWLVLPDTPRGRVFK